MQGPAAVRVYCSVHCTRNQSQHMFALLSVLQGDKDSRVTRFRSQLARNTSMQVQVSRAGHAARHSAAPQALPGQAALQGTGSSQSRGGSPCRHPCIEGPNQWSQTTKLTSLRADTRGTGRSRRADRRQPRGHQLWHSAPRTHPPLPHLRVKHSLQANSKLVEQRLQGRKREGSEGSGEAQRSGAQ